MRVVEGAHRFSFFAFEVAMLRTVEQISRKVGVVVLNRLYDGR